MKSKHCLSRAAALAIFACAAFAQSSSILTVAEPQKLVVERGKEASCVLKVSLQRGYHANSNAPTESYLIPFKLTWGSGPLESAEVVYPKPKMEMFEFTEQPIPVFGGDFEIVTKFRRAPNAALGPGFIVGKLRYQACNDKMCLPPKTVEVKLPILLQ